MKKERIKVSPKDFQINDLLWLNGKHIRKISYMVNEDFYLIINGLFAKINCSFFGDFSKDETISLKFTARLWNSTLVEVKFKSILIF